ncbi:MAG: peptidylprolyl isomerase [Hyphomicrobiales bacterium]
MIRSSAVKPLVLASMRKMLLSSMIVGSATVFSLSGAAYAQQSAFKLEDVAFSVNGVEYTNQDLSIAAVDFSDELQRVEPKERRQALINILIDMILLADEAEKVKIQDGNLFKRRMAHLRRLNLRNLYVTEKVQSQVTDELLQEQYVERLARFESEDQIRASHILVETEDEAKQLIVDLGAGKDFAELAKEKSTGPSGENGGELGFFRKGQMVEPFYNAAAALKAGEISKEPVKTQFGWHVIKVVEISKTEAPTYNSIVDQLRGQVFGNLFRAKVLALREDAKVEIAEGQIPEEPVAEEEKKAE